MRFLRLGLMVATAAFAGCTTTSTDNPDAKPQAVPKTATTPAAAPAPAPQPVRGIGMGSGMQTAPMMRSVYYAYDKADITDDSRKVIQANAEYLRAHPAVKVVVQGNADERGSAEYNLALGQRRADSVLKIMTIFGVTSDRIETVSFGKEKPRVVGHDESAWSQNRRSDIVYQ